MHFNNIIELILEKSSALGGFDNFLKHFSLFKNEAHVLKFSPPPFTSISTEGLDEI